MHMHVENLRFDCTSNFPGLNIEAELERCLHLLGQASFHQGHGILPDAAR